MNWPTMWQSTMKATALATLAERTTTTGRTAIDTPWSWNPYEVWLSRVQQPHALAARSSISEQSTAPHD